MHVEEIIGHQGGRPVQRFMSEWGCMAFQTGGSGCVVTLNLAPQLPDNTQKTETLA